jgi:hypothetical protein
MTTPTDHDLLLQLEALNIATAAERERGRELEAQIALLRIQLVEFLGPAEDTPAALFSPGFRACTSSPANRQSIKVVRFDRQLEARRKHPLDRAWHRRTDFIQAKRLEFQ